MKTFIVQKLADIEKQMNAMQYEHLYHLKATWQQLNAQRLVLEEVLQWERDTIKNVQLEEIQQNWDMGLINQEQRQTALDKLK